MPSRIEPCHTAANQLISQQNRGYDGDAHGVFLEGSAMGAVCEFTSGRRTYKRQSGDSRSSSNRDWTALPNALARKRLVARLAICRFGIMTISVPARIES